MSDAPPAYPYQNYIKTPTELGSSTKGDLNTLKNDIGVLISYVDVLVSGNSKAQKVKGPLGNKYFLDTGTTCTGPDKKSHPRNIYVNNIPDGSVPFMTSSMGVSMTQFEGLVPGVLGNLQYMDPSTLFKAFEKDDNACRPITMDVRDNDNVVSSQTQYVNDSDIRGYNPCWFKDGKNPVSKVACRQGMQTMSGAKNPEVLVQLYYASLTAVGVYFLFNLLYKKKI